MVLSMDRWAGKVAIVTGASSGIGVAIADQLVADGLQVVGIARRSDRVEKRAKELSGKKGKLHAYKADVTKEEEVIKAFEWAEKTLGPVHILINNAGVAMETTLMDGETDKWRKVIDLNVLGLCVATREAVKSMRKNNVNGHIVHINSVAGHKVPNLSGMNVYPATKHAVTALTETLRLEINQNKLKIKITSVSPGFVKSELTTEKADQSEKRKASLLAMPILAEEDIADGVRYALSTPEHVQVHELTIKPVGEIF